MRTPRLPGKFQRRGRRHRRAVASRNASRPNRRRPRSSAPGAAIYGILKRTHEEGRRELMLIEAQDEIVAPTASFVAEPL